jgi:hypothetical protein
MKTFKSYYRQMNEGGAAGHMMHPFEDRDLTFKELKELIKDSLEGKLDFVEKTDGQNLVVTWRDNQLKAARNTTTIKNPMTIDEVGTKFAGRDSIQSAFIKTMNDLESAIGSIPKPERYFGEGNKFLSVEIIYPPTKNTVDYGDRAILQFHNIITYDEKGKKIDVDTNASEKLFKELSKGDKLKQKTFEIIGAQKLTPSNLSSSVPKYMKLVKKIQGKLKDKDTIGDYFDVVWDRYITAKLGTISAKDRVVLINRYSRGFASVTKTKYKKENEKIYKFMDQTDSMKKELNKKFNADIEVLIFGLGAEVLKHAQGFLAANPQKTIQNLKSELDSTIKEIGKGKLSTELQVKMAHHMDVLNRIGTDNIAPSEGLVFKYKGKTMKLTGTFGLTHQLISLYKYG